MRQPRLLKVRNGWKADIGARPMLIPAPERPRLWPVQPKPSDDPALCRCAGPEENHMSDDRNQGGGSGSDGMSKEEWLRQNPGKAVTRKGSRSTKE